MSRPEILTSQELSTPVDILADRFIQRFDKYPRQAEDGSYFTVEKPLNRRLLYAHLRGEITLGTYLLDEKSQGRFMVLDADDEPDRRRLLALSQVLESIGCPSTYEASRRGGHLWFFFNHPLPGEEIRRFGKGMMGHFNLAGIELYPKQDRLQTGPGSLIRLPFGIHKKSSRRYGFYTPAGEPLAPTIREQLQVLKTPETVPERFLDLYNGYVSVPVEKPEFEPVEVEGERVSDRIKAAASCYEFVSRYVELDRRGRGLCPFHDDKVASFSVHPDHDYWHVRRMTARVIVRNVPWVKDKPMRPADLPKGETRNGNRACRQRDKLGSRLPEWESRGLNDMGKAKLLEVQWPVGAKFSPDTTAEVGLRQQRLAVPEARNPSVGNKDQ